MARQLIVQLINSAHAANLARQFNAAAVCCIQVLALAPELPEAWYNLGIAYAGLGKRVEAQEALEKASRFAVNSAVAQNDIGLQLMALGAYEQAEQCLMRAIRLSPGFASAHSNLGMLRGKQNRLDEAASCFRQAVLLQPDLAPAWNNLGSTLIAMRQFAAASDAYEKCLTLDPGIKYALGEMLFSRMHSCDWRNLDKYLEQLMSQVRTERLSASPFVLTSLTSDPAILRQLAELYIADKYPPNLGLGPIQERRSAGRIRLGYYSADFHNHATTYLMAELFELHDRAQFELIAFSFGPDKQDDMRIRVSAAFDRFIDVHDRSDKEVAELSRELGIDIAIDLKGDTEGCRTGIFALRAAPLQVNYLGYPGTMGAGYIDYIVADPTLIPPQNQEFYTEKIAYLPHSYQVNDAQRHITERAFARVELGLPVQGFVFCCFNSSFKITPEVFAGWMRLLKQIDSAVLWLLEDNPDATINLRKAAFAHGIASERLIFARRLPLADHLARLRTADLFLDTLPYNAHTTASDALWAGLPVLTLIGQSFASRVAASLLTAIGLPELITRSQEAYEALAIELANNPARLAQLREKLAHNRLTMPLFDTPRFTRNLEAAYIAMHDRYQAGLPPDHIFVNE